MVDVVSPAKRSEMMAGIRSRNTRPEVSLRKMLHKAGYRFRLGTKIGKIKPDIVLPKWKTAIFVHGCFWHGHRPCSLYRPPKSNSEFWLAKAEINRARDSRVASELKDRGWNVVTVWECALKGRGRLSNETLHQALSSAIAAEDGLDIGAAISPSDKF